MRGSPAPAAEGVGKLEDWNSSVRRAALETVSEFEPSLLALHADAVIDLLEDTDFGVRQQALIAIAELDPSVLAKRASKLLPLLDDDEDIVRQTGAV